MDLPLPIASLARRANNAKGSKERHDTAYFAWEASVRLAVAARPPADAASLKRPSAGHWVAAMDSGDGLLADPPLLELFSLLSEIGTGKRASPSAVTPKKLAATLPA